MFSFLSQGFRHKSSNGLDPALPLTVLLRRRVRDGLMGETELEQGFEVQARCEVLADFCDDLRGHRDESCGFLSDDVSGIGRVLFFASVVWPTAASELFPAIICFYRVNI